MHKYLNFHKVQFMTDVFFLTQDIDDQCIMQEYRPYMQDVSTYYKIIKFTYLYYWFFMSYSSIYINYRMATSNTVEGNHSELLGNSNCKHSQVASRPSHIHAHVGFIYLTDGCLAPYSRIFSLIQQQQAL